MEKVEVRRYASTFWMILAIMNTLFALLPFPPMFRLLWFFTSISFWLNYFSRRKKGKILLNNEGFFEDGELIILWEKVKAFEKVTNFFNFNPHINLHMIDGTIKKINVSDISNSNQVYIMEFMEQKLSHNKPINSDRATILPDRY